MSLKIISLLRFFSSPEAMGGFTDPRLQQKVMTKAGKLSLPLLALRWPRVFVFYQCLKMCIWSVDSGQRSFFVLMCGMIVHEMRNMLKLYQRTSIRLDKENFTLYKKKQMSI